MAAALQRSFLAENLGGRVITARHKGRPVLGGRLRAEGPVPEPDRALLLCLLGEDSADPIENNDLLLLLGGAWVRVVSVDSPRVRHAQQQLARDGLPGLVVYATPIILDLEVCP